MRKLKFILSKKSGRSGGKVVVRHQGGRNKRFLRIIDFKRDKKDVWGIVETIEIDPNRNSLIALVLYTDGDRRYITAPQDLKIGQKVVASTEAPIEVGNAMPISKLPIGTPIHNLEIKPGFGAQLVKSAGSGATVQGKEDNYTLVKLPSGEGKRFMPDRWATFAQVGNADIWTKKLRKAGTKINRGIRPTVRGVAQHPNSHPHGGGEGRSGIGLKYPKTPWGKPAVGKTRNKKKYSDRLIVTGRKKGPHV